MPERAAVLRRITRVDLASRDVHALVPALSPEVLHQLIRLRGPEACASVLVAMTPQQLEAVLDLELWVAPRGGVDEMFDPGRFGEWLESLADAGEGVAADVIGRMDVTLVAAGLSQFVRVRDRAAIATVMADDEDMTDGTASGGSDCEVGGYVISARRHAEWDAVVSILVALEGEAPDRFHAVMRGCRRLSNGSREVDGLDDLLPEPEQWLLELRLARDRRREASGHTSPADARAFLQVARRRRDTPSGRTSADNPVYAAHVRDFETELATRASHALLRLPAPEAGAAAQDSLELRTLLAELAPDPSDRRLLGEGAVPSPHVARMRTLLDAACDVSIEAGLARHRELAFLANVLVSGGSLQARAFTPQEAMAAAFATCHLGLDHWNTTAVENSAEAAACAGAASCRDSWLVDHDLIAAFEIGWAVLHEQVGMATARHLRHLVGTMRCTDASVVDGLDTLWRALRTHCDAGTPWGARDALDVIALLDLPVWASLLGLLDECPVIPHALRAVIDGSARRVSATAFDFVSTRAQIDEVRVFLSRLPGLLA